MTAVTTANKGANLIHATLKKTVRPYCYQCSGEHYFRILDTLTLKVSSQATHSANYTIRLIFER